MNVFTHWLTLKLLIVTRDSNFCAISSGSRTGFKVSSSALYKACSSVYLTPLLHVGVYLNAPGKKRTENIQKSLVHAAIEHNGRTLSRSLVIGKFLENAHLPFAQLTTALQLQAHCSKVKRAVLPL